MSTPRRWAVPLSYQELMTLELHAIQRLAAAGPRQVDAVPADEFAPRPGLVALWRQTIGPRMNGHTGLTLTVQKIAEPLPERVEAGDGRRHFALLSMAGTLRPRGIEPQLLAAMLQVFNEGKLDLPAPEADVRRIADSVAGYEPSGVPFDEQLWAKMQGTTALGPDSAGDRTTVGAVRVWTLDEPPPRRTSAPTRCPSRRSTTRTSGWPASRTTCRRASASPWPCSSRARP
jgi:hypothetical protein